jgi:hypothetical protein
MHVNGIEGHMTRLTALRRRARGRLFAITASCLVAFVGIAHAQSLETIVQFNCDTIGCAPNSGLIQGPDFFFYGTTSEGGASGDEGIAFKMDRHGALTLLPRPRSGPFWAATVSSTAYPNEPTTIRPAWSSGWTPTARSRWCTPSMA